MTADGADGGSDDDGRWLVIGGRRWRRSDPAIPEPLRAELVAELMSARRAVRAAAGDELGVASARRRVQDAKVALGERGAPWWDRPDDAARRERTVAAARTLLRHRAPEATICPSDVARVVASPSWRGAMAAVRAVAIELAEADELVVRQRGVVVDLAEVRGPIRLGRGPGFPAPPG